MFKKKDCGKCGRRINGSYDFCPHCGNNLRKNRFSNEDDWGMLGEDDFQTQNPELNDLRLPRGFNTLFNNLLKGLGPQLNELEKEMKKELSENQKKNQNKDSPSVKKSGISISISTSGDRPPEIKVKSFGQNPRFVQEDSGIEEELIEAPQLELTERDLKKISKLQKEEPITNIKRLSDKVIYELKMPGVNSLDKVSIRKLENSIEIKGLAKNKVYVKNIPINLPITDYGINKGKLFLELATEN